MGLIAGGIVLLLLLIVPLAITFLGQSATSRFESAGQAIGGSGSGGFGGSSGPVVGDHWHDPYAIWDCDHFLEPLTYPGADPHGIITYGDGVIHVEPSDNTVTGSNATLGAFASAVGLVQVESGLILPDGTRLSECDGEPAEVVVLEWAAYGGSTGRPFENRASTGFPRLEDVWLYEDHQAFTIAVFPAGHVFNDREYASLLPPSALGGVYSFTTLPTIPGPREAPFPASRTLEFTIEGSNGEIAPIDRSTSPKSPSADLRSTLGLPPGETPNLIDSAQLDVWVQARSTTMIVANFNEPGAAQALADEAASNPTASPVALDPSFSSGRASVFEIQTADGATTTIAVSVKGSTTSSTLAVTTKRGATDAETAEFLFSATEFLADQAYRL